MDTYKTEQRHKANFQRQVSQSSSRCRC